MGIEDKFTIVAEDSPHRCQAAHAKGQCRFKESIEGSRYCLMHGGSAAVNKAKKAEARNYQLAKWQARVNQFADNDKVKSLREEIGILRILLEETMGKCKDTTDLLIYSNKISELVTKVEKLVVSCHKLESSLGMTLDKNTLLNIASQMIEIISSSVDDESVLEVIIERMTILLK